MNPRLSSKRQILFQNQKIEKKEKPDEGEAKEPLKQEGKRVKKTANAATSILKPREAPQNRSEEIWLWIENNRNFIKITAICKEIGYDMGNFSRLSKQKGQIPADYLEKIVQILKRFGYAE